MVACGANHVLSPRPTTGGPRGVAKHSVGTSRFATGKAKKVQRALSAIFDESVTASPAAAPLFPLGRIVRRPGLIHPAISRLRAQEGRETPRLRQATPIKEKGVSLRATAFGRRRLLTDTEDLADTLGRTHLQSALKAATAPSQQQQQQPALQHMHADAPRPTLFMDA